MNKMQKLVLLITFWMEPVSAAKAGDWEAFTGDRPQEESEFFHIVDLIATDKDETYPYWNRLEAYKNEMIKKMTIPEAEYTVVN